MLRRNVTFCFLLCGLSQINLAQAAPSIPKMLTENGLTYCTNASGFSFNPQTADAGTSMNVVTEQIYNKLFDTTGKTILGKLVLQWVLQNSGSSVVLK